MLVNFFDVAAPRTSRSLIEFAEVGQSSVIVYSIFYSLIKLSQLRNVRTKEKRTMVLIRIS